MATDTTLTCRDCGQGFTFTAGEQEFFATQGFSTPGRCPDCRAAKKAQRGGGSYGGSSYSSYGSAPREPRQMYQATCSSCGNVAEVPFQPRGDKPVYCSDCFSQQRASTPRIEYRTRY